MLTKVFYLHALSALHVGVGQAIGVVDLPIARSRSTQLPLVPGSALKGVVRDEFGDNPHRETLFGPERIDGPEGAFAGALAFGDAHLLIFPVRSFAGVVAYVTCPFVLMRYAEDCRRAGEPSLPPVPEVAENAVMLTQSSVIKVDESHVVFEDLDLTASKGADPWAEKMAACLFSGEESGFKKSFGEHFAIISDDNFTFLTETATEIRARIRMTDRGVVDQGALWYEENLPAESVLWGALAAGCGRNQKDPKSAVEVMVEFERRMKKDALLQIGGKATVGRGLVRFLMGSA